MKVSDIALLVVVSLTLLFLAVGDIYLVTRIEKLEARLEGFSVEFRQELEDKTEEIEKKCQRMTDTCIDIVANKRWE